MGKWFDKMAEFCGEEQKAEAVKVDPPATDAEKAGEAAEESLNKETETKEPGTNEDPGTTKEEETTKNEISEQE